MSISITAPACRGNASGLVFPVNDPPFFIQELQFKYNDDKNATGLPGTIKVGAWQHTGDFEHLRLDGGGVSTALSGNDPNLLSGNFGFYIIADQQIYRFAGGEADHGVHVFGRLSTSPEDRSLVDFYADGGFRLPRQFRPAQRRFWRRRRLCADLQRGACARPGVNAVNGTALPVRSFEAAFEAYYKFQVAPGLTVNPTCNISSIPAAILRATTAMTSTMPWLAVSGSH